jgi:succinate-acetate transporter protein
MIVLLYAYIAGIVIWVLGLLVVVYHVFKFAVPGDATKKSLVVFLIFTALAILFSLYLMSGIDWSAKLI